MLCAAPLGTLHSEGDRMHGTVTIRVSLARMGACAGQGNGGVASRKGDAITKRKEPFWRLKRDMVVDVACPRRTETQHKQSETKPVTCWSKHHDHAM